MDFVNSLFLKFPEEKMASSIGVICSPFLSDRYILQNLQFSTERISSTGSFTDVSLFLGIKGEFAFIVHSLANYPEGRFLENFCSFLESLRLPRRKEKPW
ncbi:MAG: hypothetical protein D6732_27965 [Methanobacteriota archaeon]|nr:MAG: hypothetical protein D6732_27965 [Euryarchaeota archaeon]